MFFIYYFFSSFIANFAQSYHNKTLFQFSKCDFCNQKIGYSNIPVFSGFFKTKCCKKSILHYSIKELFIFLISLLLHQLGIHFVFVFYALYILSDYDILTYEINYFIFTLMIILLFLYFPQYNIQYLIIGILFIFSLLQKIGFGDVVFIAFTILFINNVGLYLLISCVIGIIWIKKEEKIPFLPSLSIGFLICLILQRI